MNKVNTQYHQLLEGINEIGYVYEDKSRGVKRKEISSAQMSFDTSYFFPAISTKKLYWHGIRTELLWFLKGSMDIRYLHKHNVHFWDKDWKNFQSKQNPYFDKHDLGFIYGNQWRQFGEQASIDQIFELINSLIQNPMNTRNIVTAWNPCDLEDMALPPCHWSFEILPRPLYNWEKEEKFPGYEYCFALKWHQRSVDTFLGLPFNIASYALLGNIIEEITGMKFVSLIGDLSRVHIYENHNEAVKEQLSKSPNSFELPTLEFSTNFYKHLNELKSKPFTKESFNNFINSLEPEDFILKNYKSFDSIKAEMLAPLNNKEDENNNDSINDTSESLSSGIDMETENSSKE